MEPVVLRLPHKVRRVLGLLLCATMLWLPEPAVAGVPPEQGWPNETGAGGTKICLPSVWRTAPVDVCAPVTTSGYGTRPITASGRDRPADVDPDVNLALRGYERTTGTLGLVDYGGISDPKAPQLRSLFADRRAAQFSGVYQVYHWDWDCNCRGLLIQNPPVTLAGLVTTPGEIVYLPHSGYDIGAGYQALVLYASSERVTLKYTADDNVISGYTLHLEHVCVDPALLALYQRCDVQGRRYLPALHGGDPIGRARTAALGVAVRDAGTFLDPRSRKDWWQSP